MNSVARSSLRCCLAALLGAVILASGKPWPLAAAQAESFYAPDLRANIVAVSAASMTLRPASPFVPNARDRRTAAAPWAIVYGMAALGLILSVIRIGARASLGHRLHLFNSTATRIARRAATAGQRMPRCDERGEFAAALDGLAETLGEENGAPPKDKQRLEDPGAWLPAFLRFNRALLAHPDQSAILSTLAETVEQLFPAYTVALSAPSQEGRLERAGDRNNAGERRGFTSGANVAAERFAGGETDAAAPLALPRRFHASEAEWLKAHGWRAPVNIPLVGRGEVLGAMSLYSREQRELGKLELLVLTALADGAALALHQARLYEKIGEQSARLREARAALTKSEAAHSEFLNVMSHEFRTPLNLIMGYTEIMQEELMGPITAEQEKCLERIMRAADDLLALVVSMLQAGSIDAGSIEVVKGEVNLSHLLGELRSDHRLPEKQNLNIIWDVPTDLPVIRTDAEKLKHVLGHLIDNAVKFTERGQVTVSSRSYSPLGRLEITISDTGIGIPGDALPLLFEKYRQLNSSIARPFEGIGLGLFIAKKFTEMLGGDLHVASEPGKGSSFTVALPLDG